LATTVAGPARLLVCLALLAGAAAIGWAAPPAQLPAFELTSLEGETVPAAALTRDTSTCTAPAAGEDCPERGRWLLVYVSPYSGASGPLLQALEGTSAGERPSVRIVVGAEPAAAKAMAKSFAGRLDAAWYADPSGGARRALALTGVPVVLGLNGEHVQWRLSGGVPDRRTLRSILVSWR
jgi:hypothetical protein